MQLPAIFGIFPFDIILYFLIIIILVEIVVYLIVIIVKRPCVITLSPGKDKPLPDDGEGGWTLTLSPGKDKPLPDNGDDDGPGT
jgi:hypothetical protein